MTDELFDRFGVRHQGARLTLIPQAVGVPDAVGAVQRTALDVIQAQTALAVLDDFAGTAGEFSDLLSVKQGNDDAHVSALPTMLTGEVRAPNRSVGEQWPYA
jgi:hypothetical protein